MMGTTGFSCIACHDFNGEKGGAGALDIVNLTERLQKNWFHLYMRDPARFQRHRDHAQHYWPGGQSIRPNVLKGDSAQQIEALWAYLADGIPG